MSKTKSSDHPASKIWITGEGRDESGKRYFKFAVRGVQTDIPPFSVEEFIRTPNNLFVELSNAGASAFSTSARNQLWLSWTNASQKRQNSRSLRGWA